MNLTPEHRVVKEKDIRETPQDLFDSLDAQFNFTVDVCADYYNAKCPRYFTEIDDGLLQHWKGERVWCNPPFSDIPSWVKKARTSGAACVVMLVPANRTEQPWWQDFIEPERDCHRGLAVVFLKGRTRFFKDGLQMGSPNFACCLLIWTSDYFEREIDPSGLRGSAPEATLSK